MTLLGKILTVCIFIMSLVFMSFAVMVFATHKNWKEVVMNPTGTVDKPLGLKQQIEQKQAEIEEYQTQLTSLELASTRERAARAQALAGLESRLQQLNEDLNQESQLLAAKTGALSESLQTMASTEDTLVGLTGEVGDLRDNIRVKEQQRDEYFKQVVAITDQVHQMQDIERRLTERRNALLAEVSRYKLVLDRNGLDLNIPQQPPELKGYVTALSQKNNMLVEVSIGKDDGLREGHYLEVSRDGQYIGRLAVVRVSADRAIGQVLKELQQRPIQVQDLVRTKTE